jgi:hypothetical protein
VLLDQQLIMSQTDARNCSFFVLFSSSAFSTLGRGKTLPQVKRGTSESKTLKRQKKGENTVNIRIKGKS